MKSLISLITIFLFSLQSHAQCIPQDPKVEAQVESLLGKMTLEDKVGQMCELAIDKVAAGRHGNTLADGKLSADAVRETFGTYKVGSILNVPEGLAQTPKSWATVIRTLNDSSAAHCNGIPQIYGVDQIHGASYTWGATLFPQEIGQASSFNKNIPYRIGEITAYETRACLIPWVYAPVMDLARSPLWSRMWESFGEDVYTNAVMASQLTRGLQGNDPNHLGKDKVAACLKHYLAYGAAVSGKDRTPSSVTYREMMEKYFQPFKACCEAGALSVMVNSSNNSGMPFHANRTLLTDWLKDGLNWDGMIVTDWADIDNLWKRDRVAANKKDAICMAINAGIDMTMDPFSTDFCGLLQELVSEGRVPMSRIDDAVRRILRLKIRIGLLDRSTWDIPYEKGANSSKGSNSSSGSKGTKGSKKSPALKTMFPDFGSDKFAQEALKMTEECMVLLKNQNDVLPLKPGTRIFVCGPNANHFRNMNGGWSYTWQGNRTDEVCRKIGKYHTFYEAIANKFGKDNVEFSEMVRYDDQNFNIDHQLPEPLNETGNSTADRISRSDVIIACIGENSYCETPGNIDDLTLSPNQLDMVKALAPYGKPIILVLNEGRPRIISEIEPLASGIVHTFLPGNYGGDALARLLSGESNFSARMPYTYPKYHGSFITYDCKPCEYTGTMEGAYNYEANTTVQWTFGSGISYSRVQYSNLRVSAQSADRIDFTIDLENQSDRTVSEPVILFISDLVATLTPDIKRVRAFDKVTLAPRQSQSLTLSIRPSDLAFVNEQLQWVLEPGMFRAVVGNQKVEFEIK